MFRIEICSGIASGKTTLANAFVASASVILLERFEDNPFWREFNADMERYAFETEIAFLLQHYHQIKRASDRDVLLICDFSFALDRAYAQVTLPEAQRAVFLAVHNEAIAHIPSPSLIVHLICDAAIELDRIQKRGREVERGVSLDYLESVNLAVAQEIEALPATIPVIKINSGEADFANDEEVGTKIVEQVLASVCKKECAASST